jgi:hypothetical protein
MRLCGIMQGGGADPGLPADKGGERCGGGTWSPRDASGVQAAVDSQLRGDDKDDKAGRIDCK